MIDLGQADRTLRTRPVERRTDPIRRHSIYVRALRVLTIQQFDALVMGTLSDAEWRAAIARVLREDAERGD